MDAEVSEEHLETIAREYLTDWKELRPHLGLSRAEEDDISRSSKEYGDQKRNFLYAWSKCKGSEATYRALIDAAKKIKNKKLADSVIALLDQERSSTPPISKEYVQNPLNDSLRENYFKGISELSKSGNRDEASRRRQKAMNTRCFYCMDYTKVCKDRKNVLDFLDLRGNYDIVNCIVCTGNENWLKCSRDPEREYPGICKR